MTRAEAPGERGILALLGRALSDAEIAPQLVVSETTVKTHVARVQAVIYSYESGVVSVGDRPFEAR